MKLTFLVAWLAVAVAGLLGWVLNASAVVHGLMALPHLSDATGALILRVVGVFIVPLGAVLGFMS